MIGIEEIQQRAEEIIRQVESTARAVVVSRDGRPIVEIRPIRQSASSLLGSVAVADGVDLTTDPSEWVAVGPSVW